uniref:Cytochrome c oxidase subunit 3 n=1 Tax=Cyanidiococcus yangmingshanensis TaxID=2690220 RepID=A0A7G5VUE3_9RHOD|nr:cytochrome c oxidase subunit 3 [Cyanidiococcus yangmingshanensis]QMX77310.1 cytochrome c oxidase subunit 3 [Cyanidiococcus yangmingshanensis]
MNNLNKSITINNKHLFHLVDPSPWPLIASFSLLVFLFGLVSYFHGYKTGDFLFILGLIILILTALFWWRDVIRESTYEGCHTSLVQLGLRYGMVLFIFSEVILFVSFFWAFFHSSLSPTVELGITWPPKGIEIFNPWQVPFLNTMILLLSGCSVTWAHHSLIHGNRYQAILALIFTILLAMVFTSLQFYEYMLASFCLSDGIYGSTFFIATGLHGLHVIVGTLFLLVCLTRLFYYQFTTQHHFGFEAAAWYWHFVDVVWLFLFISIYWWGSV